MRCLWNCVRNLVRVGIVGIAVVAVIFHDQQLDAGAILGMGLIIAGIVIMRTYSTMSLSDGIKHGARLPLEILNG